MNARERRERTNIVSECLSSGCKNLSNLNSLLVVFRRIKRNIRTRTFLNLVPIFTLKCTSALSCFLREKEREICVSFEQQRKERSGRKAIFSKRRTREARFLKNNPRRRRRRRRERLKTRTAETTPTTTKTNLVLHFQVYVFAFVFFLFFFGIHFISRKKQIDVMFFLFFARVKTLKKSL